MVCKDIYNGALYTLGDGCISDTRAKEYEERAPYLIAAFCCEASSLDVHYRQALGLVEQKEFTPVSIALSDEFPLSDRFFAPAVNYLASMLISDENGDLSDKLFSRCCDALATIHVELPMTASKIKNMYI